MMNKKETTISFAIWFLRQERVISFVLLSFMDNEQYISTSLQECMGSVEVGRVLLRHSS